MNDKFKNWNVGLQKTRIVSDFGCQPKKQVKVNKLLMRFMVLFNGETNISQIRT